MNNMPYVVIGDNDADLLIVATPADSIQIRRDGKVLFETSYEDWKVLTTPVYREIDA